MQVVRPGSANSSPENARTDSGLGSTFRSLLHSHAESFFQQQPRERRLAQVASGVLRLSSLPNSNPNLTPADKRMPFSEWYWCLTSFLDAN